MRKVLLSLIYVSPIALAMVWTVLPLAAEQIIGRASVIDGDTIDIHGQRIRLYGIDAPEKGQPCYDASKQPYRCGQKAAIALDDFIGVAPVTCDERDVDRYGRIVARCLVRGESINAWLVRQGYAMAYRKYSGDYVSEEAEAKNARRGLWVGSVLPPWEWRKSRREGLKIPSPPPSLLE